MEREGVVVICLILALILVVGIIVGCIIYFPPSLELKDELNTLIVGKETQITLNSFGIPQAHDAFYYASEDPDIVAIDENGVMMPAKEGKTVIYIQSRTNHRQRILINVEAKYEVIDMSDSTVDVVELKVNDETNHAFWHRNSFAKRIADNNIIELGKIIVEKGKDEYIFTDLFESLKIENENILILADWTNNDVDVYTNSIPGFDLKELVIARTNIDPLLLGDYEIWISEKEIISQIASAIKNYQSKVNFSNFDASYEYRICIKIDYSIYKTVNYYSKGLLDGMGSLVGGLFNQEVSTFLESYTYNETRFELELDGCELVIERRVKEK